MGIQKLGGGNTHAHPSPETDLMSLLFRDGGIDIQLSGSPARSDASDMYCPQIRRSPLSNAHAVNHIDVVSCWKGLSLRQASEALMWERFHDEALVVQVTDSLRTLFLRGLPPMSDSIPVRTLLMENICLNNTRFIEVDIQRLVYDMIGMLYEQTAYEEHQSVSSWFSATQDLPAMVYNFVRTRDYYLEASPKCYVQVTLSYTALPSALTITGVIDWHEPTVEFLALPISLCAGEEYFITPEYMAQGLGLSTYPLLRTEVEFSVSSNKLPVR
ncbi:hypothetical protein DM02DRAFT_654964 [Periconia macrospinosa]|uniref:Uncharacterized protein n=1 Tax=Periconia macrospinosa TaxID=97972 RepID=A0A2V1DSS6_9PLEO|nr:hypothetical protein DM02DRAFT_654964 [Periconia macrospinosa]